jgi:phosphate acetyltransferase
MARSLYISAAEPHSGKVLIALGLMGVLDRTIHRIGFFRPVAVPYRLTGSETTVPDRDVHLMREVFSLDGEVSEMFGVTSKQAETMTAAGQQGALLERILEAYKQLEGKVDFVICEGTDFLSTTPSIEFDFNTEVARDLNAPVVLVVDGSSNEADEIFSKAKIGFDGFRAKGCEVLAVFVNKVRGSGCEMLRAELAPRLNDAGIALAAFLPYETTLAMPRMDEVTAQLGGRVLYGKNYLHNKVGKTVVASGSVETMIPLLDNNLLLVTHTDRHDAILMALVSLMSHTAPNIGGIVLSGEQELAAPVRELIEGLPGPRIPIVRSPKPTYETVLALTRVRAGIEPGHARELEVARQQFETSVDTEALTKAIRLSAPRIMTPKLFKYELITRARAAKKHIVLPEGEEERILEAADALLRLRAVELTLLGNPENVLAKAGQLGISLDGARIENPKTSAWLDEFVAIYQRARAHKGMTFEAAREYVLEPTVFGTLMVHTGHADGLVAGATTSTAMTIRPAFQVIKTRKGFSIVSSVFFMCLEDRVLVYGDCAVNPDPTASELAEIALASAETAQDFGIEPIVAMLSYSTGESGQGADVEKVKEAVKIARAARPSLLLEGPLQYDAAVDASVAKTKLPGSQVGGRATVFIFPDLNTGNNTYKAVQRSARAIAIGPVLQGLNKPVNDLSRGCLVEDIINTVAITAIQAQGARGGGASHS